MKLFSAHAIALIALHGSVCAADLNAPINTTPTLGSEIRRGMDAAFQCSITLSALNYAQCIFGIEEKNKQKVVDYQPFDLGLFFWSWLAMDIVGYPRQEVQGDLEQKRYADGRRQAASMYSLWRDYQKKLGVTDEQLVSVASLAGKKKDPVIQRLEFWSKLPAQKYDPAASSRP